MKEKTIRLSTFAQQVGLKTSQKKTEVMMLNVLNPSPVKVNRDLPTTVEFTYLGSTVRHDSEQAASSGITSIRPGMLSEC